MRKQSIITLFVGLALWAAPGAAFAKNVNIQFKTDLDPCGGSCVAPADNNSGKAEYRKQTKQEFFRTHAAIELPSAALGLADVAAAQAADVRVILTRATVDYAECSLAFAEVQ